MRLMRGSVRINARRYTTHAPQLLTLRPLIGRPSLHDFKLVLSFCRQMTLNIVDVRQLSDQSVANLVDRSPVALFSPLDALAYPQQIFAQFF